MVKILDIVQFLENQMRWSLRVFGPSMRTGGITKHIESELEEIRAKPNDLSEWIDVVILGLDGAWRAGYTPEEVATELLRKQEVNFARNWPPPAAEDMPNEHIHAKGED